MINRISARFARAFFLTFCSRSRSFSTWNDLFCSCMDDVSIWWHMFNFVFLCPKRWFQFNSRIVTFFKHNEFEYLKSDCRNAKLHFQMTFSLTSMSCLLKLPTDGRTLKWFQNWTINKSAKRAISTTKLLESNQKYFALTVPNFLRTSTVNINILNT